jgi:hypothetical protein
MLNECNVTKEEGGGGGGAEEGRHAPFLLTISCVCEWEVHACSVVTPSTHGAGEKGCMRGMSLDHNAC